MNSKEIYFINFIDEKEQKHRLILSTGEYDKSIQKFRSSLSFEEKKILKCFIKKKNNLIPLLNNDFYSKNEQSLPNVYMPNGAIYIFKVNDFNKEKNFPTKNVFPFLMSDIESIDIDSIKDLRLVRKIFQKK